MVLKYRRKSLAFCLLQNFILLNMGQDYCGVNEAMVIMGCRRTQPLIIRGPRHVWICPTEKVQRISSFTNTLSIQSNEIVSSNGLPVCCVGITQIKIQINDDDMLFAACKELLGKPEEEIRSIASEIFERVFIYKVVSVCQF